MKFLPRDKPRDYCIHCNYCSCAKIRKNVRRLVSNSRCNVLTYSQISCFVQKKKKKKNTRQCHYGRLLMLRHNFLFVCSINIFAKCFNVFVIKKNIEKKSYLVHAFWSDGHHNFVDKPHPFIMREMTSSRPIDK